MAHARTVIETDLVAARIDAACSPHNRLAEMYEALKWLVARAPTCGTIVSGTNPPRYVAKTYTWRPGGAPSIAILYEFNDDEVVILSSRVDVMPPPRPPR